MTDAKGAGGSVWLAWRTAEVSGLLRKTLPIIVRARILITSTRCQPAKHSSIALG